jgi:hypothetical protein
MAGALHWFAILIRSARVPSTNTRAFLIPDLWRSVKQNIAARMQNAAGIVLSANIPTEKKRTRIYIGLVSFAGTPPGAKNTLP